MILYLLKKSKFMKLTAIVLLFNLLAQICFPAVSYALTSGPQQPEFTSFEPVNTTQMVDEFSGDFTYNLPILDVPGPDGSGYSMSLSYHSGASLEEEASWVGYGWTLNPGAINRGTNGFPDDVNGGAITNHNRMPKNWTAKVSAGAGLEFFSTDYLNVSSSAGISYNNFKGFGYSRGVLIETKVGSIGYNVEDGERTFTAEINPFALLKNESDANRTSQHGNSEPEDRKELWFKGLTTTLTKGKIMGGIMKYGIGRLISNVKSQTLGRVTPFLSTNNYASTYGYFSTNASGFPLSTQSYKGGNYKVSLGAQIDPAFLPIGINLNIMGSYSYSEYDPTQDNLAYGYMYLDNVSTGSSNQIMDYGTEKLSTFSKSDYILGIPFSKPDNYMVTGNGIGGGFRMHRKNIKYFTPNKVVSETDIVQFGASVHFATDFGFGWDGKIGTQKTEIGPWKVGETSQSGSDESQFFRFNNDMGGSIAIPECLQQATFKDISAYGYGEYATIIPFVGQKEFDLDLSGDVKNIDNSDKRSGRSSYIGYNTNAKMSESLGHKNIYSYTKSAQDQFTDRNDADIENNVGEFAIVNETGQRYVYGLPVYSKKEFNLQYDAKGATVSDNFIAIKEAAPDGGNDDSRKVKLGEEKKYAYPNTYLLTEITTPDYVDRTLDGITDDDLGGYTRFVYDRAIGSTEKNGTDNWYHWRMPYKGFYYSRNSLSDSRDDRMSYSSGDKEIYYLKNIVTKTHVAIFTTSARKDGREASSDVNASKGTNDVSLDVLQQLDKIEIYAIDDVHLNSSNQYEANSGKKPIKTVHFKYNYTLCKNVPNNLDGSETGKLTLEKIWFEYEGLTYTKISPYEFQYEYPSTDYPSVYSNIEAFNSVIPASDQNPDYDPRNIDAWGNFQYHGADRHSKMQNWLDQTPSAINFDPAAYQLKKIILPSGGEIHIQYEQDDYLYVQDKIASAMVSLTSSNEPLVGVFTDPTYNLNVVGDLGIPTNKVAEYATYLNSYFQNESIYFKMLYSLWGYNTPNLSDCNAEYITGYTKAYNFTAQTDNTIKVTLGNSSVPGTNIPKRVCREFVQYEKAGMLTDGNCDASVGIDENNNIVDLVKQLAKFLGASILPGATVCMEMNEENSYLRLPVMPQYGKKGGGIRVKRLLMYDKGIDKASGNYIDPSLYGNEYIYKTKVNDGRIPGDYWVSSGVAANEPGVIREENTLTNILPRKKQNFFNKLVAGKDRKQLEGPIGESILPSPSVGYSSVIIKGIHSSRTNTGVQVKEFHTYACLDDNHGTWIENSDIDSREDYQPPKGIFTDRSVNNLWATQGFVFHLNDMHGKIKSISQYALKDLNDITDFSKYKFISGEKYEYFGVGEKVPMFYGIGKPISMQEPGVEMEYIAESRKAVDEIDDGSIESDATGAVIFLFFVPFFSDFPKFTEHKSAVHTHVTNKIIRHPSIVKSVTAYRDGAEFVTINKLFDPQTGKALVTETYDAFHGVDNITTSGSTTHDGKIYSINMPANFYYDEMGQKAHNQLFKIPLGNSVLGNLYVNSPVSGQYKLTFINNEESNKILKEKIVRGDQIILRNSTNIVGVFHVHQITNNNTTKELVLLLSNNYYTSISTPGNVTGSMSLEITHSGKTNQLTTMAGNITTYGNPSIIAYDLPKGDLLYSNRKLLAQYINQQLSNIISTTSFTVPIKNTSISLTEQYTNEVNSDTGCTQICSLKFTRSLISGDLYKLEVENLLDHKKTIFYMPVTGTYPGGVYTQYVKGYIPAPNTVVGEFDVDQQTGNLIYYNSSNHCYKYELDCIDFCDNYNSGNSLSKVLSCYANVMSDNWNYTDPVANATYNSTPVQNLYENGERGKWRMKEAYVYNKERQSVFATTDFKYNYNTGTYTMDFFKWDPALTNPNWILKSTILEYSPGGSIVSEVDALGVSSILKYTHNTRAPYLVAYNAEINDVYFESFEENYHPTPTTNYMFENGKTLSGLSSSPLVSSFAHAGKQCLKLPENSYFNLELHSLKSTARLKSQGLSTKVWMKTGAGTESPAGLEIILSDNSSSVSSVLKKIIKVGEWTLCEAVFTPSQLNVFTDGNNLKIKIANVDGSTTSTWYIDDFRVQPLTAKMTSFVYDKRSGRILTNFDEQNIGSFMQYDIEGRLIRKQRETDKGLKTIAESHINITKKTK